jgi:cation:H+ antiporter
MVLARKVLTALLQLLLSGVIIVIGGITMARTSDAISRLTGIGHFIGGALLIASATSLPDLLVGVNAVRNGWVDLAVGDLLGAALMNMLVLAVLDMARSSRGRMLSRTAAAHALSGAMAMTLLALVGIAVAVPERLNPSIGGVDAGVWAVGAAYCLGLRLVFFDQQFAAKQAGEDSRSLGLRPGLLKPVAGYLIAAALIFVAAPILTRSANRVAELTGLGDTFLGTVFLPLSTTLPEFAAGVTALRMRAFPLVVGNAFGSIGFNLLLLVPLDFIYDGSLMAAASPVHVVTCFSAILVIAITIMGQLYHVEQRISFLEPDALLIIVLVFAAFGLIYYFRLAV